VERFDAAVIGAGPGGYAAALRLAAHGARVVLIERDRLGGVCLNRGCIPTKTLLQASGLCAELRRAGRWGLHVGRIGLDWAQLMRHKDAVIARLRKGLEGLLARRRVHCIAGQARILEPGVVLAETADGPVRIHARNIVLATGTSPAVPTGIVVDHRRVLTTDDALTLAEPPDSLLVIGGGTNGVEFATIFSELEVQVTVVEMLDRLMPAVDPDVGAELARSLKRQGAAVLCGKQVRAIEPTATHVVSTLSDGMTIETSCVLLAAGRRVCLDDLGLESLGLERDGPFVRIDAHCRTSVPGLYAVGDITGKAQYAHVAYRQGLVAADAITGLETTEDYRVVPAVAYTHPQVAQVGLSEQAARAAGYDVVVAKFPLTASGAAQAADQTSGFCKLIATRPGGASSEQGKLLGAVLVGPHAAETIHELVLAIKYGHTVEQIAEAIHAHPSFAEAISECADAILGRPLHVL